ncbi:MAG: DNA (cytosine-5-)-methyltransferase [Dethiobacter sp.]|nr:DNA (cytosine-5-)-methyltransferase [Dethiobacter sp.]
MKKYKIIELFAGAGGFSHGFQRFEDNGFHPFELIAAVEIDRYAANTLISAFVRHGLKEEEAEQRVICDDITKDSTKKALYNLCPEVDIMIGGPPCQSYSVIGPRSGCKIKQAKFARDSRDMLFEHYVEIVSHYQPKIILFENVKGITSKSDQSGKKYIEVIASRFEQLGYNLDSENSQIKSKYIVLNAADYGVPQFRERVFLIGNNAGVKNPYPQQSHCPPEMAEEVGLFPYVTLMDAIGDLPLVYPKITLTPRKKGLTIKDVQEETKLRINKINEKRNNGCDSAAYHWYRFNNHYNSGGRARKNFLDFIKPVEHDSRLTGHIARGQQESDIELFKEMDEGMSSSHLLKSSNPKHRKLLSLIKYDMNSFFDKYKKLSWIKPCNTIFAHMQKDGNRFIEYFGA